jgi:hypothetical protein
VRVDAGDTARRGGAAATVRTGAAEDRVVLCAETAPREGEDDVREW